MPHLSPLSWILAPMTLLFLIMIIMSFFWWQNNPLFPKMNSSFSTASFKWTW